MQCPICNLPLTVLSKDGYICPNDDGVLIASSHLIDKNERLAKEIETEEADTATKAVPQRKHDLTCPHCGAAMHRVDYNSSGIIIDSCVKCRYRWLDKGEFKKIVDIKPKIDPKDLLFLLDLQQKTEALNTAGGDDPNPKVPLYSGGWGGFIRGNMAGDSRRTLGYLAGAGMYGLIVGIIKSKFIRIIAPFIILGFIILGYLIYKQVRLVDWSSFP